MLLVIHSHVQIRAQMYSNLSYFKELSHLTRKIYSSEISEGFLGPKTNTVHHVVVSTRKYKGWTL